MDFSNEKHHVNGSSDSRRKGLIKLKAFFERSLNQVRSDEVSISCSIRSFLELSRRHFWTRGQECPMPAFHQVLELRRRPRNPLHFIWVRNDFEGTGDVVRILWTGCGNFSVKNDLFGF